ncbi:RNA pseudouridylate synthase domain-containing protein 2 [Camponotus floridanus]|uniref:RNA pseudouridylate synthase domain-containing protein 2 n=1 Tax=Camponotus floridanus TaxID=104421 RepID=E2AA36_CAMFO|nr:RNA pseudouridylate synthase domain-containing protein 2 [Camponotus floridanus]
MLINVFFFSKHEESIPEILPTTYETPCIFSSLRKVYPYYFTFTTFTKGRWVGEKILEVFAREFRAHPAEEYERCIRAGTLTVNYQKVDVDYRLRHNDLLANVVHRCRALGLAEVWYYRDIASLGIHICVIQGVSEMMH